MSALERLWKDKMDIYRYNNTLVNNVTKQKEEKLYSDIKCHYSGGSLADTGTGGAPTLMNSHKVFCSIGTDLKEGDKIVVTQRNGKKITLSIGEGFPFNDHMEFGVKRSDTA